MSGSADEPPDSLQTLLEQQKQQFSDELHDALLPLLFVARMHAESLRDSSDDPALQAELTTLVGYLTQASSEGRRLIVENHPPELQDTPWHEALRHYVERGLPPHTVDIQFDFAPAAAEPPAALAIALYRIAQETIRNAVRHACATHIRVATVADEDGLTLTIRDDGRGFRPSEVDPNRFGLRNIASRAKAVGGTATITSSPDDGTCVQVRI